MYRYYKHKQLPIYFMIWDWKDDIDHLTIAQYSININDLGNGFQILDINTGGDDICLAICDNSINLEQASQLYKLIFSDEDQFE